jgi:hypothetical protein
MEAPQTCGSGEIFWDTNMHSGMPFYDFTFSNGGSGICTVRIRLGFVPQRPRSSSASDFLIDRLMAGMEAV